jgi:hypothetical protein
MPDPSGEWTRPEAAELDDRVDRFRAAWAPDRTPEFEEFLPPPSPLRPLVLVALVRADMELRAAAGLSVRIDPYLDRYGGELAAGERLVPLLAAEYRLRRKTTDQAKLKDYKSRFPRQYQALSAEVRKSGRVPPPGARTEPKSGGAGSRPKPTPLGAKPLEDDTLPAELEYKLIRPIGYGAYGQVYEAEAPGGFRVAVKRITRNLAHPASQGEIEALEAIKAITHPFVVQTHAYWVFQDHLVIVMELADGCLTDRVTFHKKAGRMGVPPEELIPFFEQAAEALDHLHSRNVSHRDVKPQNLLVLKGYAKVADFGLARSHEDNVTIVGYEVGTPAYMAPEVWNKRVSLHSDQYSLAASYVAARLGRPMFAMTALHELSAAHCQETPDLEPLPEAEREVLLRALAKEPENRYPTCVAFARALRAAVLAESPAVRRAARWQSVALVIAAALVCALTLGVLHYARPRPVPTGPGVVPPKELWLAAGWQPAAEDDTVTLSNGKEYYCKLTRTVAGEELVAVLIPRSRADDPPPFYMLRDKVTNRVFAAEWERAPTVLGELTGDRYPGKWRLGARNLDGADLGIDGPQAGVPVVRVTGPEAMVVAELLGGLLPTHQQWVKATGAREAKEGGPAGPPAKSPEELVQRGLALGLRGPWPVNRATPDVSVYEIHQLTSNGVEWTREQYVTGRKLTRFDTAVASEFTVRLVGQSWEMPDVLGYKEIQEQGKSMDWTSTDVFAGFRVVLEPE